MKVFSSTEVSLAPYLQAVMTADTVPTGAEIVIVKEGSADNYIFRGVGKHELYLHADDYYIDIAAGIELAMLTNNIRIMRLVIVSSKEIQIHLTSSAEPEATIYYDDKGNELTLITGQKMEFPAPGFAISHIIPSLDEAYGLYYSSELIKRHYMAAIQLTPLVNGVANNNRVIINRKPSHVIDIKEGDPIVPFESIDYRASLLTSALENIETNHGPHIYEVHKSGDSFNFYLCETASLREPLKVVKI